MERSLVSGGDTGRLVSKKMKASNKKKDGSAGHADADEYPGYARFVEEATIGYSAMQVRKIVLVAFALMILIVTLIVGICFDCMSMMGCNKIVLKQKFIANIFIKMKLINIRQMQLTY